VRLFAGDDWAEDHHDIEVMDEAGKVLARKRLPEGTAGMAQLHTLIGQFVPEDDMDSAEVVIGIETGRGPWVAALVAAGYAVFPVTTTPSAAWPTGSSASCTAASRPEPPTTRPPPGAIGKPPSIFRSGLTLKLLGCLSRKSRRAARPVPP
jgi:hypothetical protein